MISYYTSTIIYIQDPFYEADSTCSTKTKSLYCHIIYYLLETSGESLLVHIESPGRIENTTIKLPRLRHLILAVLAGQQLS